MGTLQVKLLGRFELRTSAGVRIHLAGKPAELLAFLALSTGKTFPRERLAGILWPEISERRARANLSTILWRLRAALAGHGDRWLVTTPDSVALNCVGLSVDVEEFRKSLRGLDAAHLRTLDISVAQRGLQLYEGDLLEDWDVQWCLIEREELRQTYITALRRVAEACALMGRYDRAVEYARKAVSLDPLSEQAQVVLARVLRMSGDRVGAVSQIRKFARLVQSELGVPLEHAALERLVESDFASQPSQRALSSGLVVGREAEKGDIKALIAGAERYRGGAALILGDTGVGKSRLVDWAREEWAVRGGLLARGSCVEFSKPLPYQAIVDVLREFADDQLLRVSQELTNLAYRFTSDGGEFNQVRHSQSMHAQESGRLFRQVFDRLHTIGQNAPVLIVVEDLQWADPNTIDLLAYLSERLRNSRVMLLMSSRAELGRRHALHISRLEKHCSLVIRVGPLSRSETGQLVDSLTGHIGLPTVVKDWIYGETEGNPLFVVDVVQSMARSKMSDASLLEPSRHNSLGLPKASGSKLPESVRNAMEWRLALVPRDCVRLASVAAVLGRSFHSSTLASVFSLSEGRLGQYVETLIRSRILEREGECLRFCHGAMRILCYEMLPSRTRAYYHKRAALVLSEAPYASITEVAWHESMAGEWERGLCLWEQAGFEAVEAGRPRDAREAFEWALTCARRRLGGDVLERNGTEFRLLLQLDQVLARLGKVRDRRDVLTRMETVVRRLPEPEVRVTYLTRRALFEEHVGNLRVASSLAKKAYFVARRQGLAEVEPEALRVLAWTLSRQGKHRKALALSRLYLRKYRVHAPSIALAVLRQAAGTCLWLCDYATAQALLRSADALAHEYGMTAEGALVSVTSSIMLRSMGQIEAARASLEKGLKLARESEDPAVVARAMASLAVMDILEGRLGDGLLHLRRALTVTRWAGSFRIHVACVNLVASGIARLLGDYNWAGKACKRALRMSLLSGSFAVSALCRDTQAQLLLEQGRFAEALEVVNDILTDNVKRDLVAQFLESLPKRAAILLGLGDVEAAIRDFEDARRMQERVGESLLLVETLTLLAMAYARRGDLPAALEISKAALRALVKVNHANPQPQRIYWYHYLILQRMSIEPRIQYLRRAVELIESRAATLSRAQQRRFKTAVLLNREILAAWEKARREGVEEAFAIAPDKETEVEVAPSASHQIVHASAPF